MCGCVGSLLVDRATLVRAADRSVLPRDLAGTVAHAAPNVRSPDDVPLVVRSGSCPRRRHPRLAGYASHAGWHTNLGKSPQQPLAQISAKLQSRCLVQARKVASHRVPVRTQTPPPPGFFPHKQARSVHPMPEALPHLNGSVH